MARARTPLELAKISGQSQKNKARYKDRKTPGQQELGPPPDWMNQEQVRAWESFTSELPWLYKSHRALLEMASSLRAEFWKDPVGFGVNRMNQLRMMIGQMGGTPSDASKIYMPDDDEDDEGTGRFFN